MTNSEDFIHTIRNLFPERMFDVDISSNKTLYVFDDVAIHKTVMSETDGYKEISLVLKNVKRISVKHICIDGGVIEHGLEDYVGDGVKHGRFDCMLFTSNQLLLVELKMNVETGTKDKGLWSNYSKAMKQLKDFYVYLKMRMHNNATPLSSYYTDITPVICMKYLPSMERRNVQRLNEKEKFKLNTGLKDIMNVTSIAIV